MLDAVARMATCSSRNCSLSKTQEVLLERFRRAVPEGGAFFAFV